MHQAPPAFSYQYGRGNKQQERSDYKTLHCLIYGRHPEGGEVRFLLLSRSFHHTTEAQSTKLLNNAPPIRKTNTVQYIIYLILNLGRGDKQIMFYRLMIMKYKN